MGTVTEVGPAMAKVNLPLAANPDGQMLHGHRFAAGEVGEFVVIECRAKAIFARVIDVRLPDRERLSVDPQLGEAPDAHPLGRLQLLASVTLSSGEVSVGIAEYPRLGSRIYSAHPLLVKWIAESTQRSGGGDAQVVLEIASLAAAEGTTVNVTPERLFGRHCAILGATGGGKSWTTGRLIEQAARYKAKVLLLDATGEFHTTDGICHSHIGTGTPEPETSEELVVPYTELTETDLFALFRPSGQSQAPKLRAAMKSLKLARLAPALASGGVIQKAGKAKQPFEAAYAQHAAQIESASADFDITKLAHQVLEECVWPTGGTGYAPNAAEWGKSDEQAKSYCISLITRIEDMLQAGELSCVFRPGAKTSLTSRIAVFLQSPTERVLRVSLKYLPFSHDAREIVANAIGRYLLGLARSGAMKSKPLVVFLDEAHQFLGKSLGDEFTKHSLDAFDLIAKEGRKFCVNLCLATQRPRDIPEGVLSQMGTLVVHRLTNDRDREVVERASGDIDRSAAAFLPTLGPGQAVVIGVDFPIPLTIQVTPPLRRPDSSGPRYQTCWAH